MNTSILTRQHVVGIALIVSLVWALPAAAGGTTLFVDDDAPAAGDGQTWDTAYRFLSDALAFASEPANGVTEIRVGQGTYKPDRDEDNPDGTGDREATFLLFDGLSLLGGYAGIGARDPDERDVELYDTILSGDLLGNDEPEFGNNEENSFSIVSAIAVSDALVDGFVITGGNDLCDFVDPDCSGGGLNLFESSVVIRDCQIRANSADAGGGLYASASEITMIGCGIEANRGALGAGVRPFSGTNITVSSCVFVDNAATSAGGAIFSSSDGSVECSTSIFENNTSHGAFACGGGLTASGISSAAIVDCTFVANSATRGGGGAELRNVDSVFLESCVFEQNSSDTGGGLQFNDENNVTIHDCSFVANVARFGFPTSCGGAIEITGSGPSTTRIEHCDFIANTSDDSGGAIGVTGDDALLTLVGCEFQSNVAEEVNGGAIAALGFESEIFCIGCAFIGNTAFAMGGGILAETGLVVVGDCDFAGNSATTGGAIESSGEAEVHVIQSRLQFNSALDSGGALNTEVASVTNIVQSLFEGNTAESGGAINCESTAVTAESCVFYDNSATTGAGLNANWPDELTLVNCAFSGNVARSEGGGARIIGGSASITGSILWANADAGGDDEDAQITVRDRAGFTLDYSCIEGLTGNLGGTGNISADPLFVNAAQGDLRLQPGSPCIDAGDNTATMLCQTDLDRHHRLFDDPKTRDTGFGEAPIVDMGAYEFGSSGEDCDVNGLEDSCELIEGLAADCNRNALPDDCDIASGFSLDCNDNGIPDECEPQEDCNDNGIQDICDIASGISLDCNGNGIPDECDVGEFGESNDCNRNGVPDECEPDCNNDGIPDECGRDCNGNGIADGCDIVNGTSQDCDGNGVPDECDLAAGLDSDCNLNLVLDSCEIANGDAEDCNGDGIPDDCNISDQFRFDSGTLSPMDRFNPQIVLIPAPPEALNVVTFAITASADLSERSEIIEVFLNGEALGVVFEDVGNDCLSSFDGLIVDHRLFNLLVNRGDATIDFVASNNVDACDAGSFLSVIIKYSRDPASQDENGDGIPDECETLLGDLDGDGDVDAADLILLLGNWGACPDCGACPYDLDDDCNVDGSDLIILLGNWG